MVEDSEKIKWQEELLVYLKSGDLPRDKNKARKIIQKDFRYALIEDQLYRKSYLGLYLKCLIERDFEKIVAKIHEGEYRNHTGGRSTTQKILQNGYYWPTSWKDSEEFTRKCYHCQRNAPLVNILIEQLSSIRSLWPFMNGEWT